MKRFIISAVAALMCIFQAQAQKVAFHMGLEGGVTLSNLKSAAVELKNKPGGHAGIIFSLKLPAYFSVQPSLQYEFGRSQTECRNMLPENHGAIETGTLTTHNVVVPIALQWGPDLGLFRPFVEVVPFVGFNMGGDIRVAGVVQDKLFARPKLGVGLGGGVEVWRLQLSARYNWNFGDVITRNGYTPFDKLESRYSGVTVTASIFLF